MLAGERDLTLRVGQLFEVVWLRFTRFARDYHIIKGVLLLSSLLPRLVLTIP